MPDTAKQTLKCRTGSHSDVADTPAARAYQASRTESQFGDALLKRLRESPDGISLRNFREEWLSTDDGLIHELSADAVPVEA